MKRLFSLFAIVTLLLILVSCAPKKQNQKEVISDTTAYKPIIMEENTEDTTDVDTEAMSTSADTTKSTVDTTISITTAPQSGYRVQVFATFSEEKADMIANQVRERTTEPVYVEYIAPYYKVRVGDCTTRDEAESLKSNLFGLGYSDAFIVQDTINPK
ncbi:SPOR domain-containing protein [candidate division WOR-3 bacterium]|nr:SPOR domain-containing protein [candidate division WOR-3 bacterium]